MNMLGKRESRDDWDPEVLWRRYCGFLDLSLGAFMEIQEQLLMEQLATLRWCPLGQQLIPGKTPESVEEFQARVPLTTYETYKDCLEQKAEDCLPKKPAFWAYTSDDGGVFRWVPFTMRAYERLIDNTVASAILAAARHKGELNLPKRPKTLFNIPPRPYLTGMIAFTLFERGLFAPVLPLDQSDKMDFKERIERGFEEALNSGVDLLGSLSSVLVRMGEGFTEASRKRRMRVKFWRPAVTYRLARAALLSKLEGRPVLPKDLWPVKAIVCWGIDTDLYRDKIVYYWGHLPYELFASTEMGIIALQSWRKAAMTFVPDAAFLEFIPEQEWIRSRRDPSLTPRPVLIDQIRPGQVYELVITSFYGMPFVRFRVGYLIRVTDLSDPEAGIQLPQIVMEERSDQIIDMAGFTRLGELSVLRALQQADLEHEGWVISKKKDNLSARIHLYIEMKAAMEKDEVARRFQDGLVRADPFYKDLNSMIGNHNLRVTLLSHGTFRRYYDEKARQGLELGRLRPPKVNPGEAEISDLLRLG